MRAQIAAIGVTAILAGLLLGGIPSPGASASSALAGGSVHVVVQLEANNPGEVLIAGALGDYGTTLNINQDGTPNSDGAYSMDTLGKGAFEVNETMLVAKADKTSPTINQSNCSGLVSVTAPITLFNGTGLYKGIGGTLSATESIGFIVSRYPSGSGQSAGRCARYKPVAQLGTIEASGTVKFS